MPLPTKREGIIYLSFILLMIILKFVGVIGWSWWIVLAPAWFPVAFLVTVALFVLLFVTLSGGSVTMYKVEKPAPKNDFDKNYF